MSMPYPQDRARARQDEGEQPFKDAKETLTEKDAKLQASAGKPPEPAAELTEEERTALQEQEASERLGKIGEDANQS